MVLLQTRSTEKLWSQTPSPVGNAKWSCPEGLPWWLSGKESTCQRRRRGFHGSWKIPHTMEQWSPGTTPTEPTKHSYWSLCILQPELHSKRRHGDEKPPQLEKKQQWRSSTAKSQHNFFKKLPWNTTPHISDHPRWKHSGTVSFSWWEHKFRRTVGRFLKTKHATIIWHSICTPGQISEKWRFTFHTKTFPGMWTPATLIIAKPFNLPEVLQ